MLGITSPRIAISEEDFVIQPDSEEDFAIQPDDINNNHNLPDPNDNQTTLLLDEAILGAPSLVNQSEDNLMELCRLKV